MNLSCSNNLVFEVGRFFILKLLQPLFFETKDNELNTNTYKTQTRVFKNKLAIIKYDQKNLSNLTLNF